MKRNLKKLAGVFSKAVHEYSLKHSVSLLEACLFQCEEFGIEPESLTKYMTKELHQMITDEASKNKLIKAQYRKQDQLNEFFKSS